MMIDQEAKRNSIVRNFKRLKQDQAIFFEALEALTSREQDIIRACYSGQEVPQCTPDYINELLTEVEKRLSCYIVQLQEKDERRRGYNA